MNLGAWMKDMLKKLDQRLANIEEQLKAVNLVLTIIIGEHEDKPKMSVEERLEKARAARKANLDAKKQQGL